MLKIGVTETDWHALQCWGREAVQTHDVNVAARRLLAVLLHTEGKPPRYDDCPAPERGRPQGSVYYAAHIRLSQTTDSKGTCALWVWGHERGCVNVAQSFRLLMAKLVAAYPDPRTDRTEHRTDCLYDLVTAIEEKSHLAHEVKAGILGV